MTRQEQINNVSNQLSESFKCSKTFKMGFETGTQWADENPKSPWISVEDSLPFEHEELIRKHYVFKPETVYVFVKKHDNTFGVDYMLFDNEKWKWMHNFGITHWMIIPKLSE